MRRNRPLPPIAEISGMTSRMLGELWEDLTGKPAPGVGRCREIRAYALAWEIQARQHGGLLANVRRKLAALAQTADSGRKRRAAGPKPSPGTILVRTWRGRRYRVSVGRDGYEFEGTRYTSLSQIAGKITGTRWNGPAFFGLRAGKGRHIKVAGDGA